MSVRWREDRQKWEAAIVVNGKRRRPLFDLKKEALDAVSAAKKKKFRLDDKEEVPRIPIDVGFAEYHQLESVPRKSAVSASNDRRYFNLAFHYLTEERNLTYLGEIALQDLEGLQRWLLPARALGSGRDDKKERWSESTVNRAFHTFDHFFNKMCAWGKLEKNPAQFLKSLPERPPAKRAPLTREIYEGILSYAGTPDWYKDVLEMTFLNGPRGSSVERFDWTMVNFHERWFELDTRKGANAVSKLIRLPLTDQTFALLIKVRNKWPNAIGAVFRYDNGEPVRADRISKVGNRILRELGHANVDLYGQRHGLASDLINAGVEIEVVRQLLGHSNVKTTQNYTRGTNMKTLARALELVRGQEVPPVATNEELKTAVGADGLD